VLAGFPLEIIYSIIVPPEMIILASLLFLRARTVLTSHIVPHNGLALEHCVFLDLVGYLVVFLVIKRTYYELTTGAAQRAIIKKHGCEPVHH
jgi:hypothetical protein